MYSSNLPAPALELLFAQASSYELTAVGAGFTEKLTDDLPVAATTLDYSPVYEVHHCGGLS